MVDVLEMARTIATGGPLTAEAVEMRAAHVIGNVLAVRADAVRAEAIWHDCDIILFPATTEDAKQIMARNFAEVRAEERGRCESELAGLRGRVASMLTENAAQSDMLAVQTERATAAEAATRAAHVQTAVARDAQRDSLIAAETAGAGVAAERGEAADDALHAKFQRLLDAASGLCFGTDWNHGTHAEKHGYRKELIAAVAELCPDHPVGIRAGGEEG